MSRFPIILAALLVLATAAVISWAMVPMTAKVAHIALSEEPVLDCRDAPQPHEVITVIPAGYDVVPVEVSANAGDGNGPEPEEVTEEELSEAPEPAEIPMSEPTGDAADFRRDGVWWVDEDMFTWYSSSGHPPHHMIEEFELRDDGIWTYDGYVVCACDYRDDFELFDTPFGTGIVLDHGCEGVDVYVCW